MKNRFRSIRRLAIPAVFAVTLAACAGTQQNTSAGEFIDDSVITTKVKTNLLADKMVSGLDISVETVKGRVLLAGYVKSKDERRHAEELARSVGGVRDVSNKLLVK
jgi:osmotically-inducible protein OsmY